MIKSIIVDDERKHRETSKMLLNAYCPNVEVLAEAKDKNSFINVLSKHKPDLVFLDINLGSSTAFDILDDLEGKIDFKIVFVTASERYAIEGYKYNAVDYLLKPINAENLVDVVKKVEKEKSKSAIQEIIMDEISELYEGDISSIKISMNTEKQESILKIKNIIYLSGKGESTLIKMVEGSEITVSRNLEYFESKLDSLNFKRTHDSYIINTDHVIELNNRNEHLLMTNKEEVPVSKAHKNKLLSHFNF